MLCLDMKFVARLRGISSRSSSNPTSSSTSPIATIPTTTSSITSSITSSPSTSASNIEENKSGKVRQRESGEIINSFTTTATTTTTTIITTVSDSEEKLSESMASLQEMISRNRSRSVCVAAILPSSLQIRQLRRRASHVYVNFLSLSFFFSLCPNGGIKQTYIYSQYNKIISEIYLYK